LAGKAGHGPAEISRKKENTAEQHQIGFDIEKTKAFLLQLEKGFIVKLA
jgi:hypothetical protein